jgi:enoyl-[acyl-carrier protein] reductase I
MFSDLSRYITMQNLFHDGGFSFTGVSEAIVNSMKEEGGGKLLADG